MYSNEDIDRFIEENADSDVASLRLKYSRKDMPFDIDFAITQIECRRKFASKLPFLLSHPQFRFPSVLSSEQSTSECLARFHASLISDNDKVLDITSGLGVDDYFLSRKAKKVVTFDIVKQTAQIAAHNFSILGADNIDVRHGDSIEWLRENPSAHFDVIFVDPARRGEFNTRTYAFKDCSPDISANMDLIRHHADRLIVKASPMFDITQLCRELPCVRRIWVLSVKNECKEVLAECDFRLSDDNDPLICALNFLSTEEVPEPSVSYFKSESFPHEEIHNEEVADLKGKYLYEPDSSVLKSGGSAIVADKFDLEKLSANTSLYVSDLLHDTFPGRKFRVKELYSTNKLKGKLKGLRRNVICRNFPMRPSQLVVHSGIKEGADKEFLIGASVGSKKKSVVFDCEKIDLNHLKK